MRVLCKLSVCSGILLAAMSSAARADSIVASIAMSGTPVFGATAACPTPTGCNSAGGYDHYFTSVNFQGSQGLITNPNVVPNTGGVTAANSTIVPYFTIGNPVTFTPSTFPLQPAIFSATISSNPTSGGFLFASSNGQTPLGIASNATLQFFITSYTISSNYANAAGTNGAVNVAGNGYFVETATGRTFTNSAATFTINAGTNGSANFSASDVTNAAPVAVTPEPNSLILFATGLLAAGGVLARRRFAASL